MTTIPQQQMDRQTNRQLAVAIPRYATLRMVKSQQLYIEFIAYDLVPHRNSSSQSSEGYK